MDRHRSPRAHVRECALPIQFALANAIPTTLPQAPAPARIMDLLSCSVASVSSRRAWLLQIGVSLPSCAAPWTFRRGTCTAHPSTASCTGKARPDDFWRRRSDYHRSHATPDRRQYVI